MRCCFLGLVLVGLSCGAKATSCHPSIDPSQDQYTIGYGSLMNQASRSKTEKSTHMIPVIVKGFQRGWFLRHIPSQGTYLGVQKHHDAKFNGVLTQVARHAMPDFDKREVGYCRVRVNPSKQIEVLTDETIQGQVWIYLPQKIEFHTDKFPVLQSYIDVFMAGCLQVEKRFHLKSFFRQCRETTSHWNSKRILKDRGNSRYPNLVPISADEKSRIDELLKSEA